MASTREGESDHDREQGEVDFTGATRAKNGEIGFLHHEEGYEHHDREQDRSRANKDAENEGKAAKELRQSYHPGEEHREGKAETANHTGKHLDAWVTGQFAVAMQDKDQTSNQAKNEKAPAFVHAVAIRLTKKIVHHSITIIAILSRPAKKKSIPPQRVRQGGSMSEGLVPLEDDRNGLMVENAAHVTDFSRRELKGEHGFEIKSLFVAKKIGVKVRCPAIDHHGMP